MSSEKKSPSHGGFLCQYSFGTEEPQVAVWLGAGRDRARDTVGPGSHIEMGRLILGQPGGRENVRVTMVG